MSAPTKVEEIKDLPNVVLKAGKAVKFFLCANGHIEPWTGEPDNVSMPWRPCKQCHSKMELTSRRIKKDGSLVPTRLGPRTPKPKAVKNPANEQLMLRRLAKGLKHPYVEYKFEWVTDTLVRVTRKGDRPWQQGDRMYKRYAEVTVDVTAMKAHIKLYGVRGWFEEFRTAAKRLKLFAVPEFLEPLSTLIVRSKSKTAKGGRR